MNIIRVGVDIAKSMLTGTAGTLLVVPESTSLNGALLTGRTPAILIGVNVHLLSKRGTGMAKLF